MANNIQEHPLVSVVTVNYNHSYDTIEFLESLEKITYPNIEVIVVDNGSKLEDYNKLAEKYDYIKFIRIEKNIGFAGANNKGLMASNGEYVLSINNDIIVTDGFLEPLIKKMQENPEYGCVCPRIYFYDQPQNIQFAGYTEFNKLTIRNSGIGFNEPDVGQYDKDSTTAFAHGAAMLTSRKIFKEIGLMSTYFFLYYEDMDWGKRLTNAGYKIGYVHNTHVYHKDSVTNGQNSPTFTYYNNRGRLIYMRRNITFPMLIISTLYMYLFALPKNLLVFVIKREFKNAQALIRAYIWYIPHMFDKNVKDSPKFS